MQVKLKNSNKTYEAISVNGDLIEIRDYYKNGSSRYVSGRGIKWFRIDGGNQMKYGTMYLTCPYCKDEDASEESEMLARDERPIPCRSCGKIFKAKYNRWTDMFYCEKLEK